MVLEYPKNFNLNLKYWGCSNLGLAVIDKKGPKNCITFVLGVVEACFQKLFHQEKMCPEKRRGQ